MFDETFINSCERLKKDNQSDIIQMVVSDIMKISAPAKLEKGIDVFVDWLPHVFTVVISVYLEGRNRKDGDTPQPDYVEHIDVSSAIIKDNAATCPDCIEKINRVLNEVTELIGPFETRPALEIAMRNLDKGIGHLTNAMGNFQTVWCKLSTIERVKGINLEGKANADLL